MLASCEVKQGRTDGDRWAEDFIETYIDNPSFFFFVAIHSHHSRISYK